MYSDIMREEQGAVKKLLNERGRMLVLNAQGK